MLDDWQHRVDDIGNTTLHVELRATADQLAELAQKLDVADCSALTLSYELKPASGGRFVLLGALKADVTQSCIVTLEPLRRQVSEDLEFEFLPENLLPEASKAEQEILTGDNGEPIENGIIDVGRLAFEVLSAGLDPFPKKDDANFKWETYATDTEQRPSGPFASLGKLKGDG